MGTTEAEPTDQTSEHTTASATEDVTASLGIDVSESPFSLELSQDQLDIQEWAHGFAEQTVRPAAQEWDEKEEFPWPVVQEAAKIGLYGFESMAQFWADPSGLTFPIVNEELFWGDAGIGMAIFGTTLAVAGIFALGHARAAGRVGPAVLRDRGRRQGRRRSARRSRTPARTCRATAPPPSTTRPRTSGS